MFLFYFLIGVGLLFLGWTVLRWFTEADPKQLIKAGRVALAIVGGAVALWFIATGKAYDALFLATSMAPFFIRWKALWTQLKNAGGPTPGGSSDVETAWLRMSLDHATGTMDGTVRQGRFRGRRLGELTEGQLAELFDECHEDGDSAVLIESYLDRLHPGWRDRASETAAGASSGAASGAPSGAMSRDEAWRVLGLEPGADETAIRDAHRRLMKKLHPDQGGSGYLAAKINQAKDLLLGG
jgi:hypothetical protein